jgi:alpha-tubulin suppressor-like RCC1 family protein
LFEPLDGYTGGAPADLTDAALDAKEVDASAPDVPDVVTDTTLPDANPPDVTPDTYEADALTDADAAIEAEADVDADTPDAADVDADAAVVTPVGITLSVGFYHNCAIKGKALSCWGYNVYGMLGIGSTETKYAPVKVDDSEWLTVSAGYHTCGIKTNGKLFCWGYNVNGELGDGTTNTAMTPVQIGSDTWLSVSAGWRHTCAIRADKKLFCWGANSFGQVGDGTQCSASPYTCEGVTSVPRLVGSDWASVSVGKDFTCGLKLDGSLYCWGDNTYGELGVGLADAAPKLVPTKVGTSTWQKVSAYWIHACARRSDSHLFCWGDNRAGQIGNGTLDIQTAPVQVGDVWLGISAGKVFTCGLKADYTAYCWGHNQWGQLGDGSSCPDPPPYTCANKSTPTAVAGGYLWDSVFAGGGHSCGIRDETLYCWGLNDKGQLGDTTSVDKVTPQPVSLP